MRVVCLLIVDCGLLVACFAALCLRVRIWFCCGPFQFVCLAQALVWSVLFGLLSVLLCLLPVCLWGSVLSFGRLVSWILSWSVCCLVVLIGRAAVCVRGWLFIGCPAVCPIVVG